MCTTDVSILRLFFLYFFLFLRYSGSNVYMCVCVWQIERMYVSCKV